MARSTFYSSNRLNQEPFVTQFYAGREVLSTRNFSTSGDAKGGLENLGQSANAAYMSNHWMLVNACQGSGKGDSMITPSNTGYFRAKMPTRGFNTSRNAYCALLVNTEQQNGTPTCNVVFSSDSDTFTWSWDHSADGDLNAVLVSDHPAENAIGTWSGSQLTLDPDQEFEDISIEVEAVAGGNATFEVIGAWVWLRRSETSIPQGVHGADTLPSPLHGGYPSVAGIELSQLADDKPVSVPRIRDIGDLLLQTYRNGVGQHQSSWDEGGWGAATGHVWSCAVPDDVALAKVHVWSDGAGNITLDSDTESVTENSPTVNGWTAMECDVTAGGVERFLIGGESTTIYGVSAWFFDSDWPGGA